MPQQAKTPQHTKTTDIFKGGEFLSLERRIIQTKIVATILLLPLKHILKSIL